MKRGFFHDRRQAGRVLAKRLAAYVHRPDVIVLGLPRGGVPVAYEVAEVLGAPLDTFVVRKLGVPGHEELAMGAIATGDVRVLNDASSAYTVLEVHAGDRVGLLHDLVDGFIGIMQNITF